jgi:hypothetical protein
LSRRAFPVVTSFYNFLPNFHILRTLWAYNSPDTQEEDASAGQTIETHHQQQEDVMKVRTVVCGALVLTGIAGYGQNQDAVRENVTQNHLPAAYAHQRMNLDKAQRNYLAALASSNDGVVQSAIANAAKLRLACPERDLRDLHAKISELALHGMTPAIRYKAYLASYVFDQPGFLSQERRTEYRDDKELFTAIASRLQKRLIGSND